MTSVLFDVAIIGGGPSGLAAAAELKARGTARVLVIEREAETGGVPRHCGHPPFGMREFGRVLTGPAYARRLSLMAIASGADILTSTAVTAIDASQDDIRITCSTRQGMASFAARRVLLATGTRESPRSARLTSGERPLGVINTGALQAYAYLEHLAPFRRPIIVGSELVALSAILTCRSLGARPMAMIEEGPRPLAPRALFLYPRLQGIPLLISTRLVDIVGSPRVDHVIVEDGTGERRRIDCDGVIFSGRFVGEAHLARLAGLDIDPATGGPEIDQFGRSSHPAIFAAGNLLRPVETAGWCYREGRRIGGFIHDDLQGQFASSGRGLRITPGNGIRYIVPQWIAAGGEGLGALQLRVHRPVKGRLAAQDEHGVRPVDRYISALPERRVLIPSDFLAQGTSGITLGIVD